MSPTYSFWCPCSSGLHCAIACKLYSVTEFPELQAALRAWVNDAVERLSRDDGALDYAIDPGHWQPDPNGVFQYAEYTVEVWNSIALASLLALPSWHTVLDVLHADIRLNDQVDTLVGTAYSGTRRIEAASLGRRVLPRPNELADAGESFVARYAELELFLATDEIEYTTIWPLPGLTSDVLPVQLDSKLELAAMSDRELGFALDTEIIRPPFPRGGIFWPQLSPQREHRTCARYRHSLPKLVGDRYAAEELHASQEIEDELRQIEAALRESLSIVLPDAIGVAGRFDIVSQPGSPLAGGVGFRQATLPQGPRLRRVHMNDDQASELVRVWTLVRQPGLQRHKGLALALRRLSYQAQREQPEDELLDTIIAAEALYLTEMGDAAERGELRYRLALRAALWTDPEQVGFTKREVLSLMKSAYDARSAIAHGGTPKPKDMKVRGQKVSLPELAKIAKSVIVAGCKAALERIASGKGWPPDWDVMALDNS